MEKGKVKQEILKQKLFLMCLVMSNLGKPIIVLLNKKLSNFKERN